jgi:hypothetical protein
MKPEMLPVAIHRDSTHRIARLINHSNNNLWCYRARKRNDRENDGETQQRDGCDDFGFKFQQSVERTNARTDRRGRPSASASLKDVTHTRSLQ